MKKVLLFVSILMLGLAMNINAQEEKDYAKGIRAGWQSSFFMMEKIQLVMLL